MSILRKLRFKLADKLVGNEIVLFAPQEVHDRAKLGDYLGMPDAALAAQTRRWFYIIDECNAERDEEQGRPLQTMLLSHSVLSIFQHLRKMNAETGDITIRGTVDGGKSEQVFRIEARTLPADSYEFGEPGVTIEHGNPEKPDAVTKLAIGADFSEAA